MAYQNTAYQGPGDATPAYQGVTATESVPTFQTQAETTLGSKLTLSLDLTETAGAEVLGIGLNPPFVSVGIVVPGAFNPTMILHTHSPIELLARMLKASGPFDLTVTMR